jgi:hypothetical protein
LIRAAIKVVVSSSGWSCVMEKKAASKVSCWPPHERD